MAKNNFDENLKDFFNAIMVLKEAYEEDFNKSMKYLMNRKEIPPYPLTMNELNTRNNESFKRKVISLLNRYFPEK